MTADDDLVLVDRRATHAVVTLNRPEKRNAVNVALAERFRAVMGELESVPVIVLTGAGDRSFCAGMDLDERGRTLDWSSTLGAQGGHFWLETIEEMRAHPAVFIAAVNGFAVGGGLTLVNNSELAVASSSAQFGMPELGFGAFPALAGPSTIRRVLPKHVAQLVLTAQRIDAETALQWGLVNEVVEPSRVVDRASKLAAQIAEHDPIALAYCKKGLRDLELSGWSEGLDYGTTLSNVVKSLKQNER